MEFSLTDFRREDFEALWGIDQTCFPPGIAYSRRELSTYIQQEWAFTLVARLRVEPAKVDGEGQEASGEPVGFLVAHAGRRSGGHIITIDVLPAARRLGLGSQLLLAAEERLRTAGCRSVNLETAVDNQAALAFYKRHDYFLVRTVPRYYANEVDALMLEKDLLSAARAS